jgi:hypothetical protein
LRLGRTDVAAQAGPRHVARDSVFLHFAEFKHAAGIFQLIDKSDGLKGLGFAEDALDAIREMEVWAPWMKPHYPPMVTPSGPLAGPSATVVQLDPKPSG